MGKEGSMEREKLFKVFKTAIDDERRARNFYMSAAALTSDPDIRKIFEELASVESSHEAKLLEKYTKLRDRTF